MSRNQHTDPVVNEKYFYISKRTIQQSRRLNVDLILLFMFPLVQSKSFYLNTSTLDTQTYVVNYNLPMGKFE